ncbi:MAG: hypothetical protein M1504_00095, partial [Candidatus Marsarchaeota archaeon]|nr:hypothetical protein [Candidatus Marsarchaeota archaeon]
MATESSNNVKAAQKVSGAEEKPAVQKRNNEIDIFGPLTFWIMIMVVGVIIDVVLAPITQAGGQTNIANLLLKISNFILYLPGAIIWPLIV